MRRRGCTTGSARRWSMPASCQSSELPPAACPNRDAEISRYGMRDTYVDVNVATAAGLVLADAWFPGWKAYIRPFGVTGEGKMPKATRWKPSCLSSADGNFRGPAGGWPVDRFLLAALVAGRHLRQLPGVGSA